MRLTRSELSCCSCKVPAKFPGRHTMCGMQTSPKYAACWLRILTVPYCLTAHSTIVYARCTVVVLLDWWGIIPRLYLVFLIQRC
jgi:hypothetical protein